MRNRREQGAEPARTYNSTARPVPAVPKYRSNIDWERMPDYDRLPDWTLITMAEVGMLTSMSHTSIEKKVKEGEFRAPVRHGRNRMWHLGYVREWIKGLIPEVKA